MTYVHLGLIGSSVKKRKRRKDLVCGKEIDGKNWLVTGATKLLHEGKTYYFCGIICQRKFFNNPGQYLKAAEKAESAG